MNEGDKGRDGHSPLKVDRQEDRHEQDEHDQALERLLGDLRTPCRPDDLDLDLALVDPACGRQLASEH